MKTQWSEPAVDVGISVSPSAMEVDSEQPAGSVSRELPISQPILDAEAALRPVANPGTSEVRDSVKRKKKGSINAKQKEQVGSAPTAPYLKKHKKRKIQSPIVYNDPQTPFPATSSDFAGVPPDAMTECLAVWHILAGFGVILRIDGEIYLDDFQHALVHPEPSPLLTTAYERLVAAALLDPLFSGSSHPGALEDRDHVIVESNGFHPDPAENKMFAQATKMDCMPEEIWKPMIGRVLRRLVARAGSVIEDNLSIHTCSTLLKGHEDWDGTEATKPFARLGILMTLADAAVGVDAMRNAIDHDMEAAAETRRQEREEWSKSRKTLQDQLKTQKEELDKYRKDNGLDVKQASGEQLNNADYVMAKSRAAEEQEQTRIEEEKVYQKLSRQEKLNLTKQKKTLDAKHNEILKGHLVLVDRLANLQKRLDTLRAKRYPPKGGSNGSSGHVSNSTQVAVDENAIGEENDADACGFRVRPLGNDRLGHSYFFFHGEGRVFLLNKQSGAWSYISSKESLDSLFEWLNHERANERRLKAALQRIYEFILSAMRKRNSRLGLAPSGGEDGRRRSGRKKNELGQPSFMTWTNNWEKPKKSQQ